MKKIDIKSFLIGFFLATTLLLAIGASKGTQDVRIVGIDKNFTDWDAILVETK
jgi:preprotein translocase subunit SecG